VAIKVGLRHNANAREAAVLSALAGATGFPQLLHHEVEGATVEGQLAPGGVLVMSLLGPSLEDLLQRASRRMHLSAPTVVRVVSPAPTPVRHRADPRRLMTFKLLLWAM